MFIVFRELHSYIYICMFVQFVDIISMIRASHKLICPESKQSLCTHTSAPKQADDIERKVAKTTPRMNVCDSKFTTSWLLLARVSNYYAVFLDLVAAAVVVIQFPETQSQVISRLLFTPPPPLLITRIWVCGLNLRFDEEEKEQVCNISSTRLY